MLADLRVQAVADRNVDEPVFAADRNRRLRSGVGQRKEPGATAAAEDDGQHVAHGRRISGKHGSAASSSALPNLCRRFRRVVLAVIRPSHPRASLDVMAREAPPFRGSRRGADDQRHRLRLQRGGYYLGAASSRCSRNPAARTTSSSSTTPAPTTRRHRARPWRSRRRRAAQGAGQGARDRTALGAPATCWSTSTPTAARPRDWLARVERRFARAIRTWWRSQGRIGSTTGTGLAAR